MDRAGHNSSNNKKYYGKLGSSGIQGSLYQIHLLTMVLLNGLRKVAHWRLSTEDKRLPQFDDLIFQDLSSGSTILLQAKHKEDEKKQVTYKDLMSLIKDADFGLPRYFFSYQEAKSICKVQIVVICTNLKLEENIKNSLEEERVDPDSVLYFEGAENICYGFSGWPLPELKQEIETYQASYIQNKQAIISDADIKDFLQHLKFFPNCLGDKNVENIVRKTISLVRCSRNLNVKMIQKDIHKKMTDWYKAKRGRYLTEVEAKAFFCDMRSNKYCEDLTQLYDIRFKNNNLPSILQTQQTKVDTCEKSLLQNKNDIPAESPKRMTHIIPDKQYVLNVVKIYQALPPQYEEKALFVNPDETVQVQMEIIDAFVVPHYTILVMVCPNKIEDTIAGEMCDRIKRILDTYDQKHVILIAEERNYLATRLKHANSNYFEVMTDNITFADLEEATRREFMGKKLIHFQGCTMSLEELFPPSTVDDLNQIVNSEIIIKFARGDESKVGLDLPHQDKYYISRSFHRNGQTISEEDLWRWTEVSGEKIILISDSAGMGKSSVLTSLGISIKKSNPHLWIVRIDLDNYTKIMKATLEEGGKSIGIIEMLNSQGQSKLRSEFDKRLFTTSKRVVLMLDGVDEISPAYTEFVINLIRDSVAEVNFAKIFVTTRPHMSKDFEEISELQSSKFESSSKNDQEKNCCLKFFTLEPFSKVNQIDFLTKYWGDALDLQDDMQKDKCNIFAEALIENTSKWINEKGRNNFAGIPLQTRMLAEIFQEKNQIIAEEYNWEGCKEFLSSNNREPKFPTRFDITQLYEMFIKKKCDVYIKKNNPNGQPATDEAFKPQLTECENFHRALAIKVIFDADEQLQYFACYTKNVEWPISTAFANNFLFKVGIVQRQGGNIEFLHRTFAEHFLTKCVVLELEREPVNEKFQQFFMASIMMDKEFSVIRAFLNSRMPDVLQNNFCSYFRRNRISEELLSRYLGVLAKEDCTRILECLIKSIDKEQREILSQTVKDMRLMNDVLYYTIRNGHVNVLKLLLELNETFNKGDNVHTKFLQCTVRDAITLNLEMFEFLLRQVDKNGKNILGRSTLHEAAFMYRLEEVKSLVEEGRVDINNKDNILEWTALQEAIFMGRLEVVKFLVENAGADINATDNNGKTALGRAVYKGDLEIVKFLVKEARAEINVKTFNGRTILHEAVGGGGLAVAKFSVKEAGAEVTVKTIQEEMTFYGTVYTRGLEVTKFLVKEVGAEVNAKTIFGKTPLHSAICGRNLEIVKFLVKEAGAEVNVKTVSGETALYFAVMMDDLGIAKFMVNEAGAEVNVKTIRGETVLHKAAYGKNLEIVKFLVLAGVVVNVKNIKGETALHRSVYEGGLAIAKLLVKEAKAEVNVKTIYGETVLHRAVCGRDLKIVKFLVEDAGAEVNAKTIHGETALHKAVYGSDVETIKFLNNEAGAEVTVKTIKGKTTLDKHVCKRDLEIVKFLVNEAGSEVNARTIGGETALHKAAYGSGLETFRFLVEAGADINIADNDGETVLHKAAYKGNLEGVKFLLEVVGVDVNVTNNGGETALHIAAHEGDLEFVNFLVEVGANVNI